MDVAQNLTFIISYYIYFKLLLWLYYDSIFILMVLVESDILLKNHVSCDLC